MITPWSTGKDMNLQQLPASFRVISVLGYLGKVLHGLFQSPEGKYICNRVATLIRRPEDRICWPW